MMYEGPEEEEGKKSLQSSLTWIAGFYHQGSLVAQGSNGYENLITETEVNNLSSKSLIPLPIKARDCREKEGGRLPFVTKLPVC